MPNAARAPTGLKPMESCGLTLLSLLETMDDLEVLNGSRSAQIEEVLARATVAGAISLSLRERREFVLHGRPGTKPDRDARLSGCA
jgi:hypothetical protein